MKWYSTDVIYDTYCRFSVVNSAGHTSNKYKQNNMNIYFSKLTKGDVYVIKMPSSGIFSDGSSITRATKGKTYKDEDIEDGLEWWIMILPELRTDGQVEFISWVSEEDLPEDELKQIRA